MTRLISILSGLILFTACQRLYDETYSQGTRYPIQFNLDFTEKVYPFPSSKSIPPHTIPEPGTTSSEPAASLERLEYIVYKEGENTPLKKRHYTATDTDFGIVYDSLPEGTYQIGFLAHSSPNPVLSEDNIFSFDSISDTFFLLKQLTVEPGKEVDADITLQRIVSKIEFVAKDAVPRELKQFDIKIGNFPAGFSLFAQEGITASDTVLFSKVYIPQESGNKNTRHAFYCFIPPTGTKIGVKLNALNADNQVYYSHALEISPEINKIVRYTGRLYSIPLSDNTFTFEINGNWGGTIENELPEN